MKRGTIAVLIILSVFVLSAAALFASSWLTGEKTSDFVANFEIKEGQGLFHCQYKGKGGIYRVMRIDGEANYGRPIDYYTAAGTLVYSTSFIDAAEYNLGGKATNCIFTIYNKDGSKTQEDCADKPTVIICDEKPIYKK